MSYSIEEAKAERNYDIAKARAAVDAPDKLRALAQQIMKEGNEPLAHALSMEAMKIENRDDLQEQKEEREAHYIEEALNPVE